MVVLFNNQTHFLHNRQHFAAHVLCGVHRVHGEVATLGAHTVAHVAVFVIAVGVGWKFDAVNLETGFVG